ncbi:hypothetical protein [Hyphomicrobium sp.]|uniref:hypothetical protein n=1 Tax=Hyphomicrobium sp. TaxID=82 RepID=UPI002CAE570F|nr:hypothetical protein [Hyphomicrobium sp.]HRN88528.1 hypothetical protein [Hyphomicrobium sp.]HRQ26782.1 hypothetical protein [Hyphomicrobium sp.]
MAHLSEKLAEMHRRIAEDAQEEQALVRALNAALNHVDEKLLAEIRHVTVQHEARRSAIMNELQLLATRLCAFPAPPADRRPAIEGGYADGGHLNGEHLNGHTHAPGNWRIAAQNVEDDDLDFFTDGPAAPASH